MPLRSGAPSYPIDTDTLGPGLLCQVFLYATATVHNDDADRQDIKHCIIALEGCGLPVFVPVWLEGNQPSM